MRVLTATVIGITAANAGFGAGLVGTILVGPWTGGVHSAVTIGVAIGAITLIAAFSATFLSLHRLRYAVLLSH